MFAFFLMAIKLKVARISAILRLSCDFQSTGSEIKKSLRAVISVSLCSVVQRELENNKNALRFKKYNDDSRWITHCVK